MFIPHLEKITNHPACMTCLRPRQGCECLGMSFTASYKQLRRAPPAFTTLTLTVPHQVSSQAGVHLSQGMPLMGCPFASAWSTTGSTSLITGWTPPGQPVFPSPATGNAPCLSGQMGGALPSRSCSGVPPVRQSCPTVQSQ